MNSCSSSWRWSSSRCELARPALEAAGLEDRRARRQAKPETDTAEEVEEVGERERRRENQHRPPLALAGAEPGARLRPLDAALTEGRIAPGSAEALQQVVDHEAQARVGRDSARRHEREHRRKVLGPIAARQAEAREGRIDRGAVELGEGVGVHAPRLAQRAARAKRLLRRIGGELDGRERRRGDHRHVAPRGHRRRSPAGAFAHRAIGGKAVELVGEAVQRQAFEVGRGRSVRGQAKKTGDPFDDHRRILSRRPGPELPAERADASRGEPHGAGGKAGGAGAMPTPPNWRAGLPAPPRLRGRSDSRRCCRPCRSRPRRSGSCW